LTIIVVLVVEDEVVATDVDVRVDDDGDTAVEVVVEDVSDVSDDSSAVEQPNTTRDTSPTSPRDRILPTTAS